jgi:hypothetical protein
LKVTKECEIFFLDHGTFSETKVDESIISESVLESKEIDECEDQHEGRLQENCPVTGFRIWDGRQGEVELVYLKVKKLLEWEQLALLTGTSDAEIQADDAAETTHRPGDRTNPRGIVLRKIVMEQEPWQGEESTTAWERYMQTEELCQHIHCQFCDSKENPLVVVTPGKIGQRRQTQCSCKSCWRFTDKHHGKDEVKDMSFFKQFNSETGRFHRALPYQKRKKDATRVARMPSIVVAERVKYCLCSPNGGLSRLSPGSGCPLRAGTGHGRPGRAPGWC